MKAVVAAALVNFLWEGVLIGGAAYLGFALSRSPRIRYVIGITALVMMAAAPVVTGALIARRVGAVSSPLVVQGSPEVEVSATSLGGEALRRGTQSFGESGTASGRWDWMAQQINDPRVASTVLAIWLIGVAALSGRLAFGFVGARRLTRRVTSVGASVQTTANRLIAALDIRARVRVVESALVKVPAVVGAFKPVVLLPAAAMSGLSIEQVEALLAHELAHVRRHDYLVNLLQSAVETLLFYHPAVWLVSRRVRQERELCCDDLALAVCGDRIAYASALADLESLRATPSPALAATGGSLLARVRRILGHDDVSALAGRSQSLAGIAILASIILLAGGQAARAKAIPPAAFTEEILAPDGTGGKRSPNAPQIPGPVVGVQGGVVGGVVQGVPGGVAGGAAGGVVGGVVGGVQGGVGGQEPALIVDAPGETPKEVPQAQQQVVGPFRVGDHIRIDLGYYGDPTSTRTFTTITESGVLDTSGFHTQSVQLEVINNLKVAGETSTTISAEIVRRFRARNLPVPPIEVTFDDRSGKYVSRYVRGGETPEASSEPPGLPEAGHFSVVAESTKSTLRYQWKPGLTLRDALATAGLAPAGIDSTVLNGWLEQQRLEWNRSMSETQSKEAAFAALSKVDVNDPVAASNLAPAFSADRVVQDFQYTILSKESELTRLREIDGLGPQNPRVKAVQTDIDIVRAQLKRRLQQIVDLARQELENARSSEARYAELYQNQKAQVVLQSTAALNRITIERKDPKTGKFTTVKLGKDKMTTPIEPNDVIKVPVKRM